MANDLQDSIVEQCRQDPVVENRLGRMTFLAFALVVFGMVPLAGLPGLLIFDLFAHTLISLLPGSHTWCRLYPDTIVPLTLCITFLWPISLPMGYAIAFHWFRAYPKSAQALIWLAVMVLWGLSYQSGCVLPGPDSQQA